MRLQAYQFCSSAAEVVCADRSLFDDTESNGNCFAALRTEKEKRRHAESTL